MNDPVNWQLAYYWYSDRGTDRGNIQLDSI